MLNSGGLRSLSIVGEIAWLGGLGRIAGEVFGRLGLDLGAGIDKWTWIGGSLALGLAIIVWVAMLPWLRRFAQQQREDLAATYRLPVESIPSVWTGLRRIGPGLAVIVLGSVALALVLPGIVAAAASVIVGLVVRLAVPLVASSRDIHRR